jgi:hypothetical protein
MSEGVYEVRRGKFGEPDECFSDGEVGFGKGMVLLRVSIMGSLLVLGGGVAIIGVVIVDLANEAQRSRRPDTERRVRKGYYCARGQ